MYNSLFMYDILHTLIVSYHGTARNNCKSIAEEGYLLCKGRRFAFGHGIYSNPDKFSKSNKVIITRKNILGL